LTENDSGSPRQNPAEDDCYLDRVRPPGWKNPQPKQTYDLVVIGGGPAGFAAAEVARRLGFSVALIEQHRLGGNSLNAGTIPSKALVASARAFGRHRHEELGAPAHQPCIDFPKVMKRMRAVRARIAAYFAADCLTGSGCDLFFGAARFFGPREVRVGAASLVFRKAIVATGAKPRSSDIPGLDSVGYRTSSSIFQIEDIPRRLAIIGAGPLGCELAQALCRLGSHVTLIQQDPRLLPREERDAVEILSRALARDGVEIRLNTRVVGARSDGATKILQTVANEKKTDVCADEVLLSIGRAPNVDGLDLECAGIEFDATRGIATDACLRTSNNDVYAAGDVCLDAKFTHAAQASARIAARNAMLEENRSFSERIIPRCTFCDPEIAHIGLSVAEARKLGVAVKSYTVMMQDIARAITDAEDHGFVKVHVELGTDRILGATIMGARSSELINEVAVIMNAGIGLSRVAEMIHTYPAESEGIMLAAQHARET